MRVESGEGRGEGKGEGGERDEKRAEIIWTIHVLLACRFYAFTTEGRRRLWQWYGAGVE